MSPYVLPHLHYPTLHWLLLWCGRCHGLSHHKKIRAFALANHQDKKGTKNKPKKLKTLLLDATEQEVTGPSREYYSGKKKRQTIKTEIIVERQSAKIVQISDPFPGRVHDITMRRKSDPIPPSRSVYGDGGYQGMQKEHANFKLPKRKPRGKPQTKEGLKHNKSHMAIRNLIERKFHEMKIFKILSHIYRNSKGSYAIKMAIIAGIVNFKNGF